MQTFTFPFGKFWQAHQQLQVEIHRRQLIERQLHAAETKMRAVFAATNDILLLVNLNSSQITSVEVIPTNFNNLQPSHVDTITKMLEELLPQKRDSVWFKTVRRAVETQQIMQFNYNLLLPGQEIWFSANISPISDNSALWMARDISTTSQREYHTRLPQSIPAPKCHTNS